MMDGPTDRSAVEAEAFLAANPDVEAAQLVLTDASGVGRGKNLRRHELPAIYRQGRYLPCSILGLDITGADVHETGLVWQEGDADRVCFPVQGTLVRAPWLEPATAQVLLNMYRLDGTPEPADPRHALAGVLARFAATGLKPVIAAELEFYLLDREPDADGRPRPPASPVSGHRGRHIQAYGLTELDDMAPVLNDIYAGAALQGLPAETAISENAPGQYEIVLRHQADALRAIDQAIMFKRLVRGVAARHGMQATFMAKPYGDQAGSGLHLHMSLQDAEGRNQFAAEDPAGTPLLRHAIGGMLATIGDAMAIFAPNANSYRRFRPSSYAPVAPSWGINNRSVSLRVPVGPPASRHVEHRVAGADANPYLAAAAVLAGVHHGITGRLDPGPPVTGDGYAQATVRLPTNWPAALELLDRSSLMRDYLGARFVEIFLAIKRAEMDRFMSQVTEADYAWYLRTA